MVQPQLCALLTWTVVAELGTLVVSPGDVVGVRARAGWVAHAVRVLVYARADRGEGGGACRRRRQFTKTFMYIGFSLVGFYQHRYENITFIDKTIF